jgi:hypothetical protein
MPPHLQRPTPLWKYPISLTLLGLLLTVGGWSLSTWRPPMGQRLGEIRGMSEDPELTRRLDHMRPMPPFEMPGRLILFGGMALFGVGVVRMYQAPKGPPPDEMPEPDEVPSEAISDSWPR